MSEAGKPIVTVRHSSNAGQITIPSSNNMAMIVKPFGQICILYKPPARAILKTISLWLAEGGMGG